MLVFAEKRGPLMERVIPLPGGVDMAQRSDLFPLTQDSVLLAGFVRPRPRERALDLGAGQGVLGLMLMARCPDLCVDGVELSAYAAEQACLNYRRAGFDGRGRIVCADLRALPGGMLGRYDLCLSNPPYFAPGRGAVARTAAKAGARCGCAPDDLCASAGRALRWGGRFFVCYRPDRLPALFAALASCRLEPKRLRFVHHQPGREACLALVEARKGGGAQLDVMPPLFMQDESGNCTPEALEMYR